MDAATPKKFIIIAEDNVLIARVLSNKLIRAGYEVLTVVNGDEALRAIAERKPDLLLLDLIMPVKDGFAVLKDVRSKPELADLKVLITSELQQSEDIQKVQRMGVLGVFDKANLQGIIDQLPTFL